MFDFNSKIAQTTQNISKFMVGKSSLQLNGKHRLISGRFHTLIWRPGDTVQTLESPGALCNVWSLPLWQQQAQHKPGKSKNSTDNFTVTFKMSTKWYYQLPWKGTKQYEGKVCGMSRQSGVAENVYFVTICPFFVEKTSRSTFLRSKFRFTATLTIFRGFTWYIYPMLKTLKRLLNTY